MRSRKIAAVWIRFWMRFSGRTPFGRFATKLATYFAPPYYDRCFLARLHKRGYIAPKAVIAHDQLHMGDRVFIGDGVVIFKDKGGGSVELGTGVYLYGDSYLQTGSSGALKIGEGSHIHPRCQLSAYASKIDIGAHVQIAPNCAFYPYSHGVAWESRIDQQPLQTKGGIIIEDGAWLGYGVIVLDGVTIGKGAVIGAGSVVTHSVPSGVIAAGVPARPRGTRPGFDPALGTQTYEHPNS